MQPSLQYAVPAYPQGMAQPPQAGPEDCPTLLGAKDELSLEAGILLKGDHVCIPQNSSTGLLIADLHGTHQGIKNAGLSLRSSILPWHRFQHY